LTSFHNRAIITLSKLNKGRFNMKQQHDLGTQLLLSHMLLIELKAMSNNSTEYEGLGGVTELVKIMTKQPLPEDYEKFVKVHVELQQMDCAIGFLHQGDPFFYDLDTGYLVMIIDNDVTMSITFTPEGTQAVMEAMTISY